LPLCAGSNWASPLPEDQLLQDAENEENEEAEIAAWKKLNDRRRILAGPAYHTSPEDREAWRRHVEQQSKLWRRHIEQQSKLAGYDWHR
jgi:hypothetical protein